MQVGCVFLWGNYPFQKDGEVKNRWFIYLGESKSDPLETDEALIFVIAPTTTSLLDFYEEGCERCKHPYVRFEPLPEHGFTHPCVLDLAYPPAFLTRADFRSFMERGEIHEKGNLFAHDLKLIYEKLCSSSGSAYSYKLKQDIRSNLNALGITGLPQPVRKARKRKA